jgi:serine phosphatase RsbU (regulator of sigma subunit)
LQDRQAGASERTQAETDRNTALTDRGAGANERTQAETDRNTALTDRGAGANERTQAETDRNTALADRGAGASERTQAELDRSAFAADIGRRSDWAIDSARLYERQRSFSEALQHSLLTAPPEPDRFQIAVRYVPATHEVQVGGDWYDAFVTPSGAVVLAIGDVVGHDTQAAAAMGQLRGLLRGIGFTTGDGPAAVLTRLEAAIEGLTLDTLATAIVARLESDDHDLARGITRFRWSNAGHPPAMVVSPDGRVQILARDEDLLLGVDPASPRRESVAVLSDSATVVLYTDGLVERRDADLDENIARLAAVLGDVGNKPLDAMCDELLARLVPAQNEDDVALLAVRVGPQPR